MAAILRYWDPSGERHGGVPTYPWGLAPDGLATRDQLVARGLRPRGSHVAQLMWDSRRGPRFAYLYEASAAEPPKERSPGQVASLEAARRRRRTCPECGRERDYYLSTALGVCTPCADGVDLAA